MAVARWQDWEGHGLEHCVYLEQVDRLTIEGVVAGTRQGLYGGRYFVCADADFRTREVRVEYINGACLHVEADGAGNWRDLIGKRPLPDLMGCIDVDIGITPATNTLPIKRLKLQEKQSFEITAAYVPLPDQIDGDFLPRRAEQRYTCLTANRIYRYEGLFRAFTADLEIDEFGLVLDYPDTFRRVSVSQ
ncbi:putative glycolipid-binding domain-containing protein [uncultured Roseobacter sp.]|uniref:putative glycolipid-binding domain-containing protein n=1 Tax=uncultured Roseobacter sp. TaxID=114847 RepID=UPI002627EA19|nr:putative glycolipid-binding domain-containing protein [uncultured Roseobacter sp.]